MYHLLNRAQPHSPRAPRIVGTYDTFQIACDRAHELLNVSCFELDTEHEECADLITEDGTLYMIEPANFKLGA